MRQPIYLDYMATTPVDPRVAEAMQACLCLDGNFANPASVTHDFGQAARAVVEQAREQVANLIQADPREIIWTSGATEANNLAIKGAAEFYSQNGKHLITCATEHKAVLDPCIYLQEQGYEVTYLRPQANGLIDPEDFAAALRPDTLLASIMLVNNEIGVIQDIKTLAKIAKQQGVLFHVDAAQAAGKIPIDVSELPVDYMSLTAHKVYGPKGIGALYVRRKPKARLAAQLHGGGHEQGLRSGTLPTHQIVGMGKAFAIAAEEMAADYAHITSLQEKFLAGLADLEAFSMNGDQAQRYPGNLNLQFHYVDGEALLLGLKDIAISAGSACTSTTIEPSYVLKALGLTDHQAHSSVRISLGRFTTEADVDYAAQAICAEVTRLRRMSPLWDAYMNHQPLAQQWLQG